MIDVDNELSIIWRALDDYCDMHNLDDSNEWQDICIAMDRIKTVLDEVE